MIQSIAGFEISIAVWCICHLKAGAWEEESEEIVGQLWVTCLHDQLLAVVGSRLGIEAHF